MGRGGPRVVIQILQISIRSGRRPIKRTLAVTWLAPPAWEELGRANGTGWASGGDPGPTDMSIRSGRGTAPQAWEELGRANGTGLASSGDPDPADFH